MSSRGRLLQALLGAALMAFGLATAGLLLASLPAANDNTTRVVLAAVAVIGLIAVPVGFFVVRTAAAGPSTLRRKSYWRRWLERAVADHPGAAEGHRSRLTAALAGPAVVVVLIAFFLPPDQARSNLLVVAFGLAASIVVNGGIFIWNLVQAPSRMEQELTATLEQAPVADPAVSEMQAAFDAAIDQLYLLENKTGITKEGREREHAPESYRITWYQRYGLPPPEPHKSRYRK